MCTPIYATFFSLKKRVSLPIFAVCPFLFTQNIMLRGHLSVMTTYDCDCLAFNTLSLSESARTLFGYKYKINRAATECMMAWPLCCDTGVALHALPDRDCTKLSLLQINCYWLYWIILITDYIILIISILTRYDVMDQLHFCFSSRCHPMLFFVLSV